MLPCIKPAPFLLQWRLLDHCENLHLLLFVWRHQILKMRTCLLKIKFLQGHLSLWKLVASHVLVIVCLVHRAVLLQQRVSSILVLCCCLWSQLPELASLNISSRGIIDPPALTILYKGICVRRLIPAVCPALMRGLANPSVLLEFLDYLGRSNVDPYWRLMIYTRWLLFFPYVSSVRTFYSSEGSVMVSPVRRETS